MGMNEADGESRRPSRPRWAMLSSCAIAISDSCPTSPPHRGACGQRRRVAGLAASRLLRSLGNLPEFETNSRGIDSTAAGAGPRSPARPIGRAPYVRERPAFNCKDMFTEIKAALTRGAWRRSIEFGKCDSNGCDSEVISRRNYQVEQRGGPSRYAATRSIVRSVSLMFLVSNALLGVAAAKRCAARRAGRDCRRSASSHENLGADHSANLAAVTVTGRVP